MNKSSNNSRTLNISLPAALVDRLDAAARREYATRSDYIRDSILRKLKDEEAEWETVVDLTKINKDGVDIDVLLTHLHAHARKNP